MHAGVGVVWGSLDSQRTAYQSSQALDVHHALHPQSSLLLQEHRENPPPQTPVDAQGEPLLMVKGTLAVSSGMPGVLRGPPVVSGNLGRPVGCTNANSGQLR